MRKPTQKPGAPSLARATDDSFAKDYEMLFEMMTHTTWDDGTPRQTSSLTIFAEDGCWKACLSDRELGTVTFVTSKTVLGLLVALEDGLEECTLDWRQKVANGAGGKNGTRRQS